MKIDDLKLSDSTRGFLASRKYGVEMLIEHRENLTDLNGIGPGREKEILRALDEAEKTGDASEAPRLQEPEPEPEVKTFSEPEEEGEPVPFEAPPESTEEVEVGGLVRYMDRSGNQMMARVAADLGDGRVNLQAFTGAGGSHRIEGVERASEWGERGRWAPKEEA